MNINFIELCNNIMNNKHKYLLQESIYFESTDDYISNSINNLCVTIQKTHDSAKFELIGKINDIINIYTLEKLVDSSSIILEYNGTQLYEKDLIQINSNIMFVSQVITQNKIKIHYIGNNNSLFNKLDNIYKIMNYKKFMRIYNSIIASNKYQLRNLYIPSLFLTKLTKSKLKSDFWNQEQKNIIYNINKPTENKKIHIIDGPNKTGKTTLLLGLLQSYLYRYENIKITISSANNKKIEEIVKRIQIQSDQLLPNNNWLMIVGDSKYIKEDLHELLISRYINNYINTINYITNLIKQISNDTIDISPIIIDIKNKLELLPFEPYSQNHNTISYLLTSINNENKSNILQHINIIINIWNNKQFINNKLIKHCNIIISSLCSSGCDSMELFENNIVLLDDAENIDEMECLISLQQSTRQLILFGNSENITNKKSLFNRMIQGDCNPHKLNKTY